MNKLKILNSRIKNNTYKYITNDSSLSSCRVHCVHIVHSVYQKTQTNKLPCAFMIMKASNH